MSVLDLTVRRIFMKRILVTVPLSSDNLSSQLSPVLGQYGIQVSDFLSRLEEFSAHLNEDLTLRVFVDVFVNGSFSIYIDSLAFKDFIKADGPSVSVENLYRAYMLYCFVSKTLPGDRALYKNAKGHLHSFNN